MVNSEAVQRLTQELSSRLSSVRQSATNSSAVKSLVQEAVAKLDLVTREDYDRLLQIHQRTRQKVDELARRLDELEAEQKNG
ncbi:accessory factor UbiK family protein [Marinospirillum sp.]|uniref:accessory factor UbiK family protein n=1 Tax=Marinospirillum sp. TaxID=2183934 RepID=UPI00286FBADB|nr:accessory factor UbiK family protein [Marinospirillum sp.]MDR9468082.1 accessory factor UbiK family protein [Marinospirillum sp.]